jgi:glycosyltransferase involved in cell wall biosynthesis
MKYLLEDPNMDLVSIIMPAYNSSFFIGESITSVTKQTYGGWELLVIDDCSTDDTPEIIERFAHNDSRIKLIKNEENYGPAHTRNIGIKHAKGAFIAFLDSDDRWHPLKLEEQIQYILESNADLVYTAYERISEDGKFLSNVKIPDKLSYNNLLISCPIGCLTVMINTERLGKVFFPEIKKRQDYALWLKIARMGAKIRGLPMNLASYRVRSQSVSSSKFILFRYHIEVFRSFERFSLIKSIILTSFIAVNAIIKNSQFRKPKSMTEQP